VSKLLIPNVTPVPNARFDHVFLNLRPAALRVLLAIVRLTYGWQKVSDQISYTQLQKVTGLSREGVNNAVKELGNLLTVKPGTKGRGANEYGLNVDITTGELVRKVDQSEKLTSQNRPEKVVRKVDSPKESIPKKYGASRKRREPADSDPRVKTLFTAFQDKYASRTGTPYALSSPGKDNALLKCLLTCGNDVPAIDATMDRYFAADFYSKTGFDVGGFAKAFNRLNSAGARKKHNYEGDTFPSL
jgi:phage replication O-like protein O